MNELVSFLLHIGADEVGDKGRLGQVYFTRENEFGIACP